MKLTIAAIVSTIAAMVLCLGYAGNFHLAALYQLPIVTQGSYSSIRLSSGGLILFHDGSGWIYLPSEGRDWHFPHEARLAAPSLHSSIWGFGYEWGKGFQRIAFPIWCPLLPCLIAPLLWLRRRRNQPAGFAVITQASE
jgi:hypothetical protein